MVSLLLFVFLLQLLIHLVHTFGTDAVNSLLWSLYNKLPTPTAANVQAQTKLRREVVRLKRELNATSSQDEFAKWAKLRRQHDKVVADYEQLTQSLQSFKATFDTAAKVIRWASLNGTRMLVQFWYRKQSMFWLPIGWVPYPVEWILSWPGATLGSISIQVWWVACTVVIQLASDAIQGAWAMTAGRKAKESKGEPMKIGAQTGSKESEKSKHEDAGEKKEL